VPPRAAIGGPVAAVMLSLAVRIHRETAIMDRTPIDIRTPEIHLDALLKFAGIVSTGGEAKLFVRTRRVRVNGEIETRRGHLVKPGDLVEVLSERGLTEAVLEVRAAIQ
jgi:ribosome-associated protein